MTLGIIAANVLIYLLVNVAEVTELKYANIAFGHIPSVAHDPSQLPSQFQIFPEYLYGLTTITAAFLHANFMHIAGNMLFIWVFGDNVEDAMGHIRFFIFYLLCAFAASWFHAFSFPDSNSPLVGASGAAAGIVAAYLMLHPRMKVWILFLGRFPLRLPAYALLTLWIGFQAIMYIVDTGSNVSWAAHVGGILAGIILVGIFKRRSVPFFDREVIIPEAVKLNPGTELPPQVAPTPPQKPHQSKWGRKASNHLKK